MKFHDEGPVESMTVVTPPCKTMEVEFGPATSAEVTLWVRRFQSHPRFWACSVVGSGSVTFGKVVLLLPSVLEELIPDCRESALQKGIYHVSADYHE